MRALEASIYWRFWYLNIKHVVYYMPLASGSKLYCEFSFQTDCLWRLFADIYMNSVMNLSV